MFVARGQCDDRPTSQPFKALLPTGWYRITLVGDRGTYVLTTCSGLHSTAGRLGCEPATWSTRKSSTLPLLHRAKNYPQGRGKFSRSLSGPCLATATLFTELFFGNMPVNLMI